MKQSVHKCRYSKLTSEIFVYLGLVSYVRVLCVSGVLVLPRYLDITVNTVNTRIQLISQSESLTVSASSFLILQCHITQKLYQYISEYANIFALQFY